MRQNALKVPYFAIILSVLALIALSIFGFGTYLFVVKNVMSKDPNEIGDFLAGFASSLAFVGILATIIVQMRELRQQTEQTKELAKESNAQSQALRASARARFTETWLEAVRNYQRRNYGVLNGFFHSLCDEDLEGEVSTAALNAFNAAETVHATEVELDQLVMAETLFRNRDGRALVELVVDGKFRVGEAFERKQLKCRVVFPLERALGYFEGTSAQLHYLEQLFSEGRALGLDKMMTSMSPYWNDDDLPGLSRHAIRRLVETLIVGISLGEA